MDWHGPDATTIFEYLERSLPTPQQQAFEAQVRECPACQEELRAARRRWPARRTERQPRRGRCPAI